MNQEESLCRRYLNYITCFNSDIPDQFNSSGNTEVYCSVMFPPSYSIYVEEFILEDFGPNNFVLLDGKPLEYSSALKWENRRNYFWDSLENEHPLKGKSNRRSNFQCIKSLKVYNFYFFLYS